MGVLGMDLIPALPLEYAVAARSLPGEPVSGDKHLVKAFPDGVLVAVIDGLGHGPEAAKAAEAATAVLEVHAHEAVVPLLQRCHRALKPTRGVAMSLASINHIARTITWGGIGNVEAVLVRATGTGQRPQESLITRNGIVGYQMSTTTASVLTLAPNDTLALATDGIRLGFAGEVIPGESLQRIADRILSKYAKEDDDALVLIARWKGQGS
jgi:phosphoserine phosphatase RsbX